MLPLFCFAQTKVINHTVAAKESYSSIGRLYNVNGRELAKYNNLDYEKGLSIGQVLKVMVKNDAVVAPPPVKEVVKQKTEITKNNEPIYHTVAAKETLYGVSKLYKVTIVDIKKWNNLQVDALSLGTKIIVGYGTPQTELPMETAFTPKEDVVVAPKQEKKVAPVEVVTEKPVVKENKPTPVTTKNIGSGFNGGYFKNNFDTKSGWENAKETGSATVFKSTSGWEDGKYYCLHNSAVQGSIIKITNNTNGKIIYAKVLDVIPDIKQNSGILLRLSNAAAAELGAGESAFDCTINYSK
jgi:LysM repeat protein